MTDAAQAREVAAQVLAGEVALLGALFTRLAARGRRAAQRREQLDGGGGRRLHPGGREARVGADQLARGGVCERRRHATKRRVDLVHVVEELVAQVAEGLPRHGLALLVQHVFAGHARVGALPVAAVGGQHQEALVAHEAEAVGRGQRVLVVAGGRARLGPLRVLHVAAVRVAHAARRIRLGAHERVVAPGHVPSRSSAEPQKQ
jgi:hypothetical protein